MWRLTPGQALACREWQGEYVLYNDLSGDTHLLAEDAVLLLLAVQRMPQDAAALAANLNADYPEANLSADEVAVLLAQLQSLSLVEHEAC
ncbi:MAG TPA: HPr-rel-A system PqqD family peptide chaperone [Telluria sp.]|nr:HPr-rel-A system PqqD family peptide chaperone [Telluria sp.]